MTRARVSDLKDPADIIKNDNDNTFARRKAVDAREGSRGYHQDDNDNTFARRMAVDARTAVIIKMTETHARLWLIPPSEGATAQ